MQMAISALLIEGDVHHYQGLRRQQELEVAATVGLAPDAFPHEDGSEEEQRMTVLRGLLHKCTVHLHHLELEGNQSQKWLLDLPRRPSPLGDHRGRRRRTR
jgi:hypothetical protein